MAFRLAEAFVQLSTRGAEALQAKLTGLQTRMQKFAGGFSSLLAPLAGFAGLRVLTQAVISQEQAETKLQAALRATGQEVEKNFARLNRLATETQKATNVDDERILNLAAMATNYGLVGDAIDTVVKQAVGLEQVTQQSAESLLKGLAKFQAGADSGLLGRALPELAGLGKAEVADFIIRKSAEGMQIAAEKAGTLGGRIDRLKGTFENFLQSLQVGEKLKGVADFFQGLIDRLAGTSQETRNLIGTITLLSGALLLLLPLMPAIFSGLAAIAAHPVVAGIILITSLVVALGLAAKNSARQAAELARNAALTRGQDFIQELGQRQPALGPLQRQAEIQERLNTLLGQNVEFQNQINRARELGANIAPLGAEQPLLDTSTEAQRRVIVPALQARESISSNLAEMGLLQQEIERLQAGIEQVNQAAAQVVAIPSLTNQLHNVREALGDLSTPAEQYAEKLAKLDKLLADNRIGQEVYADQLKRLQTSYEETINPGEKLARELQNQVETFGLAGDRLALFNLRLAENDPLRERLELLIQHKEELQANSDALKKMEEDAAAVFERDAQTIRSRAEAIIEGTRTPLENFQKELAEAFSVRDIIGEDVLQRRIEQLKEKFGPDGADKNIESRDFAPRIVGLAEFGKQFTVAGVSGDKDKQALKNQEAQIGQQKLTNEKMDELIKGQRHQAVIGD